MSPPDGRAVQHWQAVMDRVVLSARGRKKGRRTGAGGVTPAPGILSVLGLAAPKAAGGRSRTGQDYEVLATDAKRFWAIFQNASVGIAIMDHEGRLEQTNPAFSRITGYTNTELEGLPMVRLHHPGDGDETDDNLRALFSGEVDRFRMEKRFLYKGGAVRWARISVSLLPCRDGETQCALGIMEDVTAEHASDERLRAIFDNAAVGICILDKEGRLLESNPAYSRITGYSEEELVGMSATQVTHPEDLAEAKRLLQQLFTGGDGRGVLEKRYIRKDGDIAWARVTLSLLPAHEERGEAVLKFVEDITESHLQWERIKAEEARFRTVAETAADGIVSSDPTSRITYANPAAHEIFGHPPGSMEGMHLTNLMPERYRERHLAGMAHYVETGDGPIIGRRIELEGLRSDGSEFPIALSVSAWKEGDESRFTATIQDITERRRLQAERDEKERELQASNKQLEQFAYLVSHDLQAPLRHIISYSQLLERSLEGKLPPESKEWMVQVREAAERMRNLIQSLLAIARAQRAEIKMEPVPLEAVMEQVTGDLEEEIKENQALVHWQDLPIVRGNHQLLVQVFQNLVQNAIRYRREVPPRIEVEADASPQGWEIRVKDNGIGFAPKHGERIFELFQRLDTGTEGIGIGLAICRTIVERHGGTITAKGAPGKGTTFTVRLPKGETA